MLFYRPIVRIKISSFLSVSGLSAGINNPLQSGTLKQYLTTGKSFRNINSHVNSNTNENYRDKALALTTFVLLKYLPLKKLITSSTTPDNEPAASGTLTHQDQLIRLHPNPATDHIQITGLEDTALITISDLHCRILITKRITEDEIIPVNILPRGVFIVKINTAEFTIERKLEKKN